MRQKATEKLNLVESQPLMHYRDAWAVTRKMLISAREGDWDALLEFELKRNALLEDLMAKGSKPIDSDAAEEKEMAELIHDILDADDEIKKLVKAWMAELQNILGSIGTEKKLNKAYQTP